jgi:hypothetical protein
VIARGAASATIVGALIFGTTGCSLYSEKATLIEYNPSDGVSDSIGDIDLRNVFALSEDGETVALVLSVINNGDDGANVDFQIETGDGTKVTERLYVAGDSSKSTGGEDVDPILFTGVEAQVGSLIEVYAQTGNEPGKQLLVPLYDGSLPEYSDLVPETDAQAE